MNADDVTADDRARFETWRSAHACHAKAYDELVATWNELSRSGPLVPAVYFGQSDQFRVSPVLAHLAGWPGL